MYKLGNHTTTKDDKNNLNECTLQGIQKYKFHKYFLFFIITISYYYQKDRHVMPSYNSIDDDYAREDKPRYEQARDNLNCSIYYPFFPDGANLQQQQQLNLFPLAEELNVHKII